MKRLICLLLVAVLVLSGCGASQETGSSTDAGQSADTTTDTTADTTTTNDENTTTTEQTETESNGNAGASDTQGENKSNTQTPEVGDAPSGNTPSGNTPSNNGANPTGCSHQNTSVINAVTASCKQEGYSGDTYCNDCKKVIAYGNRVANTTGHTTEIRNAKEATTTAPGYTGDEVCTVCGRTIIQGTTIPQLPPQDPQPDADHIFRVTLAEKTWSVSRRYREAEEEFLRLCNEARAEVGAPPLQWLPDAYCFAAIRADEMHSLYSHTRPNGTSFQTVYSDYGVVLHNSGVAENLYFHNSPVNGYDAISYASDLFEGFMGTPNHRALILNPDKNYTTIVIDADTVICVQHFFSLAE